MITETLIKGQLLISEPSIIGDLSFNRSVILLADHDKEGSVGFIINKPLKYTINDLIPEVRARFKIYNGGPVEQDNLYFIHNIPDLIPNSIEISNGIYWGGDFESTKELINNGTIQKGNIRFFLGYTGWGENQLEAEMNSNSWIVTSNNYKNKIIGKSATHFWKEQIMELGGEYLIWSNAPENPYLN
ncbi:MAG: YqgE/AlgH family protein [Flavobacteriaceae bacterium]|jgi:putative transcriptional regulator|uniref:YqgE/AlgH family protein n=1 Tax=Flavobacterium kayseriense TaxID=2764714 RepID=A0ABR7J6Z6_9FLAO|nr:YqgE/AlgH family protein [Flavobacterium kayseriense]MBC5841310.1 YqgE/AlgH family protein [Flavobacterium kayseriense]MBC5847838.1 YqgE/AlgH family protein [Flavobacterium kayseriense]MBU0939843.1 YqgE/AlgH family protein [Bacteroidota bacterium]MBX9887443.1 YqgE/AlgH family protein [Flavobacteriaceae bacterium]